MKTNRTALLVSTLILTPITASAEIPDGLVGYTHHVQLSPTDNTGTPLIGSVGSWSWNDSSLGEDVFWRHQSDWIAITLTAPADVRFQVERNDSERDSSKLFPSFTLYNAFNNSSEGSHFGDNTSDLQWADDSQRLTYVEHLDNSTEGSLDETFTLAAGDYTILLGGNAEAESAAVMVDYTAAFSATPIPEPSTSLLGMIGVLSLLARRKRAIG